VAPAFDQRQDFSFPASHGLRALMDANTLSVWATTLSAIATIAAAGVAFHSAASAKKSANSAAAVNRIEVARETLEVYDVVNDITVCFIGSPKSVDAHRTLQLHNCVERRRIYLDDDLYSLLRDLVKTFDDAHHGEFEGSFWTSEKISETRARLNKAREMLKGSVGLARTG
jgi:hypothetical protein